MNGHITPDKLALYGGGDLPDTETAVLEEHLRHCRQCTKLVEEVMRVRDLAETSARVTPGLPEDFTGLVMEAVTSTSSMRRTAKWSRVHVTWHRAAVAAAVLVTVFWAGRLSRHPPDDTGGVGTEAVHVPVTVSGTLFSMLPVMGPRPADEPVPESFVGVYLVLYRLDPNEYPDRYVIEYVGELTGTDSGDIVRDMACIGDRAGLPGRLYVVLYPMPASSPGQRQQVARALIQTYKPYCNDGA